MKRLLHNRGVWIGIVCLAGVAVAAAIWLTRGDSGPGKLRVAYVGLTCEAPIFVAYEQGFFAEEGLDVELVATDWDGLREGLGLGRFDACQTLIMYLIKPIAEQGLDVKITGGIHTGCLRLQAGTESGIAKVQDLKGKRIGVPTHLGSPPHLFATRVLVAHGIDPTPERNEVTWIVFAPELLAKALEDGRVDAVATSDPIGTILVGAGLVRNIADQAVDPPYCDEYCCVAAVSGKLARENPQAAAKLTRALLKASKWTEENPGAAAKMAVEKKYTAASVEINSHALAQLRYIPGVSSCKRSIDQASRDMKRAGLLKPFVDAELTVERAWLDLEGVSDDWLKKVSVARVPGGGPPSPLPPTVYAELCRNHAFPKTCCSVE